MVICTGSLLLFASPPSAAAGLAIDAWGDSLTTGTPGIGGLSGTWPYQLSRLLGGRTVRNFGVSGQTSESIAARQGALVARLSVARSGTADDGGTDGNVIPVTVTNRLNIPGAGIGAVHGTLNGIPGELAYAANDRHVFIRDATVDAKIAIPADSPFIVDDYRDDINVIWAGRNDVNEDGTAHTVENIARMAARVDRGRFIVLSIVNGADEGRGTQRYRTIVALNQKLATRFPDHFIDIRAALIAHANASAADLADRTADIVPRSLRVDRLHLTADGYRIVAQCVFGFVNNHDW
ncbi:SGNH/GDSL hydrolase family protein [Paraburkholderia sp.]|uniref:SGNH/GDSL hydrolase family protein n=1 Tax=Paraburkholderia sp. TaxID=1926495 RepID=UPI003D6E6DBF